MAQGKEERVGYNASFRIEEKARRASRESPLLANSAMRVFQEVTLDWSTYLLNHVVRLALVLVEYCFLWSLGKSKMYSDIFIHSRKWLVFR